MCVGVDQDDIEGAAHELRVVAKLDGADGYFGAAEIVRALGGDVDHQVPRGTYGAVTLDPFRVSVPQGPAVVVTEAIGHELGHVGAEIYGLPTDNEDLATEIGKAILLPPSLCKSLFRAHGWDARRLVRGAPDAPASWVLGRVAALYEGVCIVRSKGQRKIYRPPHLRMPSELQAFEREYLRLASRDADRSHRDLFGIRAWVVGAKGREWSVILCPPDALVMLYEQRDRPEVQELFGEGWLSAA